jgi:hypothetical protein
MVTKTTNAHKRIKVSHIINTVCYPHVSTTVVTILREVHYTGYNTKVYEQMHRCKIQSFNSLWFKIHIKYKLHKQTVVIN